MLVLTDCASGPRAALAAPIGWEPNMNAGLRDLGEGHYASAQYYFTASLEIARGTPAKPVWLAYSSWHLGDLYYEHPELGTLRAAEALIDESHAAFAEAYGSQHPVVIPLLLRLSQIHAAPDFPGAPPSHAAIRIRPESGRKSFRYPPSLSKRFLIPRAAGRLHKKPRRGPNAGQSQAF